MMPSILLVDDDADIVDMYRRGLDHAGYPVAVATNGVEALEQAASLRPQLILLDFHLPVLDGEEVLKRLRDDPALAAIPVVIISNSIDDGVVVARLRGLGAVDCVLKCQLTPSALAGAVPGWLAAAS